jgi:hypothetical protein
MAQLATLALEDDAAQAMAAFAAIELDEVRIDSSSR